jgi:hypothetical protein
VAPYPQTHVPSHSRGLSNSLLRTRCYLGCCSGPALHSLANCTQLEAATLRSKSADLFSIPALHPRGLHISCVLVNRQVYPDLLAANRQRRVHSCATVFPRGDQPGSRRCATHVQIRGRPAYELHITCTCNYQRNRLISLRFSPFTTKWKQTTHPPRGDTQLGR